MSATTLLLLGLACFRLTHLVVQDRIAAPLRTWAEGAVGRRYPQGSAARELVEALIGCPWCCGVWAAAVLLAVWHWLPVVGQPLVWLLAVAGVGIAVEMLVGALSRSGAAGN